MIDNLHNDENIDYEIISKYSDDFKDVNFRPEITSLIDFEDKKLNNND